MSCLLQVSDIAFSYPNGHRVFENVSFTLEKGQVLAVIGPNGAGKSTLMNCLAGLMPVTAGSVTIDGRAIGGLPPEQVARLVGYMQQSVTIAYDYLVRDIVLMGRAPYISSLSLPSKHDAELADEAIASMGISHLAHRPYTQLSGGEKQQVMIARLLAQQPQLIIMDEPTSALDFGNQQKALKTIKMLAGRGFSVIMTTHNPDHAIMLGGMAATIGRGGQFQFGTVAELVTGENLSQLYGVEIRTEYVEAFSRTVCSFV